LLYFRAAYLEACGTNSEEIHVISTLLCQQESNCGFIFELFANIFYAWRL